MNDSLSVTSTGAGSTLSSNAVGMPSQVASRAPNQAPQPAQAPQPTQALQPESKPTASLAQPADSAMPQPTPSGARPQLSPMPEVAPAPQPAPVPLADGASLDSMASQSTEVHRPASTIAVTLAGNNEWGELVEQTSLDGFAKELAMNCACERLSDDKVILSLSPKTEHLLRPDRIESIQQALRAAFNPNVVVTLDVEESDKETPAECLARLGYEQVEQAKENIKNDPGVKAIMSEFGATLNEESIKPL